MPLDLAHIHLMLNHVPVVGAPLLLLLLTFGFLRRSRELILVSLALVVGLAVVTGLVYLTGEPAEHLVEQAPWFRDALAETHEEHTAGMWLPRVAWAGLALSTLLLGWTAWSGGQIRHEEVRSATVLRPFLPIAGA